MVSSNFFVAWMPAYSSSVLPEYSIPTYPLYPAASTIFIQSLVPEHAENLDRVVERLASALGMGEANAQATPEQTDVGIVATRDTQVGVQLAIADADVGTVLEHREVGRARRAELPHVVGRRRGHEAAAAVARR